MPKVEIHGKRHRLEHFESDINPENEIECVALLRQRARELKRPIEELSLVTYAPRGKRRREYRA